MCPESIKLFQKHRIDFCCGGAASLAEACRSRGLDPAALLADIRAATEAKPGGAGERWDERPLAELIDHLLAVYHRPLDEELPRAEELAVTVRDVHGAKDPQRFEQLLTAVRTLRDELEPHMHKEERILFPWIRSGNGATAGGPIQVMHMEHDAAAEVLREIRRLTNDFTVPEEACATWRALWRGLEALEASLHEHIHLENNVLFPRALAS